ncbi:bifunctional glutamate N-acetyltransferase/amino-acid acetyltransferase ArgJ [Kaarinaea lacus]
MLNVKYRQRNPDMPLVDKSKIRQEYSSLLPVAGIRLGTAAAGIKYKGRDDLLLVEIADDAQVAAVFTQNSFCAAPVLVARKHLSAKPPRYLLINAGNANAGTGNQGIENALACCNAIAEIAQCSAEEILPFSTGVIGEHLPLDRIVKALPAAVSGLDEERWQVAAKAIMTTDTLPKAISRTLHIEDHAITVSGIAKGAGMICPNMATLLSYVATDVAMSPDILQNVLQQVTEKTFNRITVDGDTSTNDACVIIATGKSTLPVIDSMEHPHFAAVVELITEVFAFLAKAIIRDAEGATKLVDVLVSQGEDESECKAVAYTIAHSPLVKTALFASDPNWGRILAAVGRAGIDNLNIDNIQIALNDVQIVSNGGVDPGYNEALGQKAMQQDDINIHVKLGRGTASANVWTCDLSYDYVKINAEYRT